MSEEASSIRPQARRRTLQEKLERAQQAARKAAERLERKKRQVQKYEAAQRLKERRHDTRRKIIAGALALEHMRHDKLWRAVFQGLLDEYVTRPEERALFGLEPLPNEKGSVESDQAIE